jgi:hypothetical protein
MNEQAEPARALEDLHAIHRIIVESRQTIDQYWYMGALAGALGIAFFLLVGVLFDAHASPQILYGVWWSYWSGAGLLFLYLGVRIMRRNRVRTFAEKNAAAAWVAAWISITLLMAAASRGVVIAYWFNIAALCWLPIGAAFFVTGAGFESPLFFSFSAPVCWLGAIAMSAWPSLAPQVEFSILISAWLIPAYLMRRNAIKARETHAGGD